MTQSCSRIRWFGTLWLSTPVYDYSRTMNSPVGALQFRRAGHHPTGVQRRRNDRSNLRDPERHVAAIDALHAKNTSMIIVSFMNTIALRPAWSTRGRSQRSSKVCAPKSGAAVASENFRVKRNNRRTFVVASSPLSQIADLVSINAFRGPYWSNCL